MSDTPPISPTDPLWCSTIGPPRYGACDAAGKTSTQQRMVRCIFVPLGTSVRTGDDAGNGTGAYGVRAPEATAEDQIEFMIEVLEILRGPSLGERRFEAAILLGRREALHEMSSSR